MVVGIFSWECSKPSFANGIPKMSTNDKPEAAEVSRNGKPAENQEHSSFPIDFSEPDPVRRFPVEVCIFDGMIRRWTAESARSQILVG